MDRPIAFMAVTNDKYELPVCYANNARELAEYLGMNATSVSSRLVQAPNGVMVTKSGKFKYMRINPNTGEVYVGKLPKAVHNFFLKDSVKKQERVGKAVVLSKNGSEIRFKSVAYAARMLGISKHTLYSAIRTGYYCGGYWRYE